MFVGPVRWWRINRSPRLTASPSAPAARPGRARNRVRHRRRRPDPDRCPVASAAASSPPSTALTADTGSGERASRPVRTRRTGLRNHAQRPQRFIAPRARGRSRPPWPSRTGDGGSGASLATGEGWFPYSRPRADEAGAPGNGAAPEQVREGRGWLGLALGVSASPSARGRRSRSARVPDRVHRGRLVAQVDRPDGIGPGFGRQLAAAGPHQGLRLDAGAAQARQQAKADEPGRSRNQHRSIRGDLISRLGQRPIPETDVLKSMEPLGLFLFATEPWVVRAATEGGVDGFVVDWEQRGKRDRQPGRDTEVNADTAEDLDRVGAATTAPVLRRINGFGPAPGRGRGRDLRGRRRDPAPMVTGADDVQAVIEAVRGAAASASSSRSPRRSRPSRSSPCCPLARLRGPQ